MKRRQKAWEGAKGRTRVVTTPIRPSPHFPDWITRGYDYYPAMYVWLGWGVCWIQWIQCIFHFGYFKFTMSLSGNGLLFAKGCWLCLSEFLCSLGMGLFPWMVCILTRAFEQLPNPLGQMSRDFAATYNAYMQIETRVPTQADFKTAKPRWTNLKRAFPWLVHPQQHT